MQTRFTRVTRVVTALLVGLVMILVHPVAAQESTPIVDQPVVVGNVEITWSGEWEHDTVTSSSVPDQATFSQVDIQTQILKVLSLGFMEGDAAADPSESIDVFAERFLEEGGATDVNEVGAGVLEDGTAWKVYTMNPSESDGISEGGLASLITSVQNDDGEYRITSLTTNTPLLRESITQVQNEFMLNGASKFFEGIDAAEVTSELPTENVLVTGSRPGATPQPTPGASPEVTVIESLETTPLGSPGVTPLASPQATPVGSAEATLIAVQDMARTATPSASPAGTPEATP